MGFRTRSATPGTLLCLAATALLAVVSFNTPLLKSLYFLQAKFSSGQYSGTLNLGTLGYCLNDVCQGPQVGYEFDPNELFGISLFDIPKTITKYLTYTLILHIVALAAAALATLFGLLSHISTLSVWCFPTCFASIASSISLIALVFDLVIFYIAKARIDDVSGASASIGISVWLVLAAWLCAGLGGCAFGIGRCCVNRRGQRESGDTRSNYFANQNKPDDMRLQALRDEQLRKKEQGLPSFQELERTPLTNDQEDKYLYEEQAQQQQQHPSSLGRNGSVVQGVGVGYGRRNNAQQGYGQGGYGQYDQLQPPPGVARRDSVGSSVGGPGAAGIGAGGMGVEPAPGQGYGQQYGNAQNNYYEQGGYNDPYNQQDQQHYGYQDPYHQQQSQHSYPPEPPIPIPTPAVAARRSADPYDSYAAVDTSMDSHYSSTGPPQTHAADPYGGYDDGLGAIGRAATSAPEQSHQRDYTGGSNYAYQDPYTNTTYNNSTPIHVPTPRHLTSHNSAQDLLRSPISPSPQGQGGYRVTSPNDYRTAEQEEEENQYNRPPSYGTIAGAQVGSSSNQYPNEKSRYR